MNNLKSIITIFAISLSTVFTTVATEKEPTKNSKNLRTEIVALLGNNIPVNLKKSCKAEISIIVNNDNEVIVVSVDSKVSQFKSYVKRKLNYKKINLKNIKKGEIYKIPVKLNTK